MRNSIRRGINGDKTAGKLTAENASQRCCRKRVLMNRGLDSPNSCFSDVRYGMHMDRVGDSRKCRRRRQLRLNDDGSSAPRESKIGEINLRQYQDQREQEQLENEQGVTPPFHESPPRSESI